VGRRTAMILVWQNMGSFKQHLEDMRFFRQSHDNGPTENLKIIKDMPVLCDIKLPTETGLIKSITNNKGKVIFVPIWEIKLAKGIQN
jgi:hypothetical protein